MYVVKPGNPPEGEGKGGAGKGGRTRTASSAATGGAPANGAGGGGNESEAEAGAPKRPPFYVDVQNVEVDLTEGTQVILKRGVNPGDKIVIDGQEKLKRYSKVDPKNGQPGGRGGGRASANTDTGADGSTPSPDAGQGALDEPRGPRGTHGKAGSGNGAPDSAPDGGATNRRRGKKAEGQP